MLNDIFFCLLGYTGGSFIDTGNSFKINETITCITDSEKELLKKIIDIGYNYKIIKDFIKNFNDLLNRKMMSGGSLFTDMNNMEEPEGLLATFNNTSVFLGPICLAIEEILKQYESEVFQLESKYFKDLHLTGSEIISKLEMFSLKFQKIYQFLQFVIEKNLKGGDFLNFLHASTITGDPEMKKLFKSFFIQANKILINFITIWIINGVISTNEFFIITVNNFIVKEETIKNTVAIDYQYKNELESWNADYYIEYSNIPSYFPNAIAEDILFIGKAIKILNSNKNSEEDKIPFNDISVFYTSLQKLGDLCFEKDDDVVNLINFEFFSKIVTLIKNCTARYLLKLVVHKKGFLDHLHAVRNMYLTYNGEFFYNFTNKIKKLLNMPFDKKIENEINEIHFKNTLKEIFNIDVDERNEKLYSNFKIKLIQSGFTYNFENNNLRNYVEKKEIAYLGAISFDAYSNSLRFMNTTYKKIPGALWNLMSYDVDEEFSMTNNFVIKNFTKPATSLLGREVLSPQNMSNNPMTNISNIQTNLANQNNINNQNFQSPHSLPNYQYTSELNNQYDLLRSSIMKGKRNEISQLNPNLGTNFFSQNLNHYNFLSNQRNLNINMNNLNTVNNMNTLNLVTDNKSLSNPRENLIERKISLNYILHLTKHFENKNYQPLNLNDLVHYFMIQLTFHYDDLGNNLLSNTPTPSSLSFSLRYVNKIKKILLQGEDKKLPLNPLNPSNKYQQISENEIEIFSKKIYENLELLTLDKASQISITFKENYMTIQNENKVINFSFPFTMNQFIPRDKRKMSIGLIVTSENLDVMCDFISWSFNFYSGEIYNENSNLVLINYTPSWPHNFLFNENILKMYNSIFNLIFPLKTNLTLLNQIWIEKKNIAKKENIVFRLIDSVHAEFVCFLQNLVSFYMFDVVDLKFKIFYDKIKNCEDFEQIINSHEEFLGEVISNSFVKSKKIMRIIFDILFTTRKFYNFVENFLTNYNCQHTELSIDRYRVVTEEFDELSQNLNLIKQDFRNKVANLITIFTKIKNTKYFAIISQLLTKIEYQHYKEKEYENI